MFLDFVEGPLWYAAVVIFLVGIAIRFYEILARGVKPDLATPRTEGTAGALRTIVTRSWTAKGFSSGAVFHLIAGYMFHIGLFVLLIFAAPHVIFIEERILGFGWAPAPHWLFIVAADLAFAGLVLLWLRRVMHPVMRQISTFDDHAAAILTFVVMFTGCMALLLSHDSLRAIHMLTVCLLMIYFPFSRLMHAFTFVLSRGYTGAVMGRKGVQA
ncbi:MAG: nitrate reductase [Gammaproteobacteria bacterium]|nr:MAG: nitrate reductase [Gammaproteobacteria bacterium]